MENWVSLTNGLKKNGMKLARTNGKFSHIGTNYRCFCCTMRVHKLKVPQEGEDRSVVVEQGMTAWFIPYRMLPLQRELWSQSILVELLPIDLG